MLSKLRNLLGFWGLTKLNDISKGERVVKSKILQFYSANRNTGNHTPVHSIHQMLGQELAERNIHHSQYEWDLVQKNYKRQNVGWEVSHHSDFDKMWV